MTTFQEVPEAAEQWNTLKETLMSFGADVHVINPIEGLPDMTFLDCGLIIGDSFIPSNFKHRERQEERIHYVQYFFSQGYKIKPIQGKFEGHGDSLWQGNKLFLGYGFRTDYSATKEIKQIVTDCECESVVLTLKLVNSYFYHLDTCFCPLGKDMAMVYPPAFNQESFGIIKANVKILIEVGEEDARSFACNAVVVGNEIIMPVCRGGIDQKLRSLGYSITMIPMDAFIKAGGACKCLTFTF
jgi:N-dimethylarginine dimethylaminohydrolase